MSAQTTAWRLSAFLGLLGIPARGLAFNFAAAINTAGWNLFAYGGALGGQDTTNIALYVVGQLRPFITFVAILLIMIQGVRMIVGQEDEIANKAKTVISACVGGIILLYLIPPFVEAFYTSTPWTGNPTTGARIAAGEVAGLINWALFLTASIAIAVIIGTGLRAIVTSGSEDGVASLRKTIIGVASGLFLLILRFSMNTILGLNDPSRGVSPAAPIPNAFRAVQIAINILEFVLGFVGLIALVVVIYAGILMILNLGNAEQATKARALLFRALIGLGVIMLSVTLIRFVVQVAPY